MNRSVGGAVGYGLRRFLRAGVWLVGVVGMAAAIELPLAHRGVPPAPVYVGEAVGTLAEPGGAATHEIDLDDGQRLSLEVVPLDASLRLRATLADGDGPRAVAESAAAGKAVWLWGIGADTAGLRTVTVENLDGTGEYTLRFWLNAAIEEEPNDTHQTAQQLDPSQIALGFGASHAAVAGRCDGPTGEDWYSIATLPGQRVSFGLQVEGGDEAFRREVRIATGAACVAVVAGEFDTVPGLDLVVAGGPPIDGGGDGDGGRGEAGALQFHRGDGAGGFALAGSFALPYPPVALASGDFDGDGMLDVAVAVANEDGWPPTWEVIVFANDGTGQFSPIATLPTPLRPLRLLAADLNGDGRDDLAMSAEHYDPWDDPGSYLGIALQSTGRGAFGDFSFMPLGMERGGGLALGDLNGDGIPDAVVGAAWDGEGAAFIGVLDGLGDGTFAAPRWAFTGVLPQDIALGDLDGDGALDAVATSLRDMNWNRVRKLLIMPGDGAGNLGAPRSMDLPGKAPGDVVLGDVDGDGVLDAVVADHGHEGDWGAGVSILHGRGDGTLEPAGYFATGFGPATPVLGDFDGDGLSDVMVANGGRCDWTPEASLSLLANARPVVLELFDEAGERLAQGLDPGFRRYDDIIDGLVAPGERLFARISGGRVEQPYVLSIFRNSRLELPRLQGQPCQRLLPPLTVAGAIAWGDGEDWVEEDWGRFRPYFADSFESGAPGDGWAAIPPEKADLIFVADTYGGADGDFALVMKGTPNWQERTINELDLTVDLSNLGTAMLVFAHREFGQYHREFDGPFTGSVEADGIAISADGVNWFPVWMPANGSAMDDWEEVRLDLGTAAESVGLALGADFRIRFQYFSTSHWDPRVWDAVRILRPGGCYTLEAQAGETLALQVTTPVSGPGEPDNDADPLLVLYDPTGNEVARDADGDGILVFEIADSGTHRIEVLAQAGRGQYVLTAELATLPQVPPFTVVGTTPADGAILAAFPDLAEVVFSEALLLTSVTPGDLTLDGQPANSVAVLAADRLAFDVSGLGGGGRGAHAIALAAGAVTSVGGTPLEPFAASFTVATGTFVVVDCTPAPGTVLPPGEVRFDIAFNHDLDWDNLNWDSVLVREITQATFAAATLDYDPDTRTLSVDVHLYEEGAYEIYLLSGSDGLRDTEGRQLDGDGDGVPGDFHRFTFGVDRPDGPIAELVRERQPFGMDIFAVTDVAIGFHAAGDVDVYTLELDAGQRLEVIYRSDAGSATVALDGPGRASFGQATVASGATGIVAMPEPGAAGVYTVRLTGAGPGRGTLAILLNCGAEREAHGGASNDVIATAEPMPMWPWRPGSASWRCGVTGFSDDDSTGDGRTDDLFAIPLEAGDELSLVASLGVTEWQLTDADGEPLALPAPEINGLPGSQITGFLSPVAATYHVRVVGESVRWMNTAYTIAGVVGAADDPEAPTRIAEFATNRQNAAAGFAAAAIPPLPPDRWVLGSLDPAPYDVEPDDFAHASNLENVVPGVTLTVEYTDGTYRRVVPIRSASATTGTHVFGHRTTGHIPVVNSRWTSDAVSLRGDFDQPISSFAIDVVPHQNGHFADIWLFDAGGGFRRGPFRTNTQSVAGVPENVVFQHQFADIAGFTITPYFNRIVTLDNLRVGVDDADYYRVAARAGDLLEAQTAFVGGGPAAPWNALGEMPGETLITTWYDPDGLPLPNQRGAVAAPVDGLYTLGVAGAFARGSYQLQVTGATGELPAVPPQVVATLPANGRGVAMPPGELLLTFSKGLLLPPDDPSLLTLASGTVIGVDMVDGRTVRFLLDLPEGEAWYHYSVVEGAFTGLDGLPSAAFAGSFAVDVTGPRVVSDRWTVFPDTGSGRVEFVFNEPLDPVQLTDSLFIETFRNPNGTSIRDKITDYGIVGNLLRVDFEGPILVGDYEMKIRARGIFDWAGNGMDQDEDGNSNQNTDTYTAIGTPVPPVLPNLRLVPGSLQASVAEIAVDETLQLAWQEESTGADPIERAWWTEVWLATGTELNPATDRRLATFGYTGALPVAPGTVIDWSRQVTINRGALTVGPDAHLIVFADALNEIEETDETDNTGSTPLTVLAPDLAASHAAIVPAAAELGEEIAVSWRTTNLGNLEAPDGWSCRIELRYMHQGQGLVRTDTLATVASTAPPLAPGAFHDQTVMVTLPLDANIPEGPTEIRVRLDPDYTVSEWRTDNNLATAEVDISAPPSADLIIRDIVVQADGLSGHGAWIEWTVENQGTAPATGWWTKIEFEKDPATPPGHHWRANSAFFAAVLHPGEAVRRWMDITLNRTAEGDYWALLTVDATDVVFEYGGEHNNQAWSADPIHIVRVPSPNLEVTAVVAPATAWSGEPIQVEWTVTNTGDGPTTTPYWKDRVFLASDPQGLTGPGERDTGTLPARAEAGNPSWLGAGDSYVNRATVRLPDGLDGEFFIVVASRGGWLGTHAEGSPNIGASEPMWISLTPPPDLQVPDVQGPATAFDGDEVTVSWTVANFGAGATPPDQPWHDRVWIERAGGAETHILGTLYNVRRLFADGDSYQRVTTVRLPRGVHGHFILHVMADFRNRIYEHLNAENNVGISLHPVEIFQAPRPDLVVEAIAVPDAPVAAGTPVAIRYRAANDSLVGTGHSRWKDWVYLSPTAEFDADTAITVAAHSRTSGLGSGATYEAEVSFIPPANLIGTWYVAVKTNANRGVFELDYDNNLRVETDTPLILIEELPDLFYAAAELPETVEAGVAFQLSATTGNLGRDLHDASWIQSLILRADDPTGEPWWLIDEIWLSRQFLPKGGALSSIRDLVVPLDVPAGDYLFELIVDTRDWIREADETNNRVVRPVTVINIFPDLVPTPLEQPLAPATVGDTVAFTWRVDNLGAGCTRIDAWVDQIVLSAGGAFGDEDNLVLGSVLRSGTLGPAEGRQLPDTYTASLTVDLPRSVPPGEYRVFAVADAADDVPEGDSEGNNVSMYPHFLVVDGLPPPNLTVATVDIPATAVAGNELEVSWTVGNTGGSLLPADGGWRDAVYLSRDQVLDVGRDIYLGQAEIANPGPGGICLGAGETYDMALTFDLPPGIAGPYYVLVMTDIGDQIVEADETDNLGVSPHLLEIALPEPVDLAPEGLQLPATALAGEPIAIDYSIRNLGATTLAAGSRWTDRIYLSAAPEWSEEAVPVAEFTHRLIDADLPGGAQRPAAIVADTPGVLPGEYYVLVHTDVHRRIHETNRANNLLASDATVRVDCRELTFDAPATGIIIPGGVDYFRLDVPGGATVRISLEDDDGGAWNQLFASREAMPSRTLHDLGHSSVFTANQTLIVPRGQPATWYIMVVGIHAGARGAYRLLAESVPLGVDSIEPAAVDNRRPTTMRLTGAAFTDGMAVVLVDPRGVSRRASAVHVESAAVAHATFELFGAPVGWHDLLVVANGRELFTAAEAVRVRSDSAAGRFYSNLAVRSPIRPHRYFDFSIDFGNWGATDVAAPLLVVNVGQVGQPDVVLPVGFSAHYLEDRPDLHVLMLSRDGDPTSFRPGEFGSQTLSFFNQLREGNRVHYTTQRIDDRDTTPISPADWTRIEAALRGSGVAWTSRNPAVPGRLPGALDDHEWALLWQRLQPSIGRTWGEYVKFLNNLARRLHGQAPFTRDPRQMLIYMNKLKPHFQPFSLVMGRLVGNRTGNPAPENTAVGLYRPEPDDQYRRVAGATVDADGHFAIPCVEPGIYVLGIDGLGLDRDGDGELDVGDFFVEVPEGDDNDLGDVRYFEPRPAPVVELGSATVVDADGGSHLLYLRDGELHHAFFKDGGFFENGLVGPAPAAEPCLVLIPADDGPGQLLAIWIEGQTNAREVVHARAFPQPGGAWAWSAPTPFTQDSVADARPAAVPLDDGSVLLTYLKQDVAINDDPDLYWGLIPPGARERLLALDPAADAERSATRDWSLSFDVGEVFSFAIAASSEEKLGGCSFGVKDALSGSIGIKLGTDTKLSITGEGEMRTSYGIDICDCEWEFRGAEMGLTIEGSVEMENMLCTVLKAIPYGAPAAALIDWIRKGVERYTPLMLKDNLAFGPIVSLDVEWSADATPPYPSWTMPDKLNKVKAGSFISPILSTELKFYFEGFAPRYDFKLVATGRAQVMYVVWPSLAVDEVSISVTGTIQVGWISWSETYQASYPGGREWIDMDPAWLDDPLAFFAGVEPEFHLDDLPGSAAVYPGNSVDADVAANLVFDGPPAIVRRGGDAVTLVWIRERDPRLGQLGADILGTDWTGSGWTAPRPLSQGPILGGDVTLAANADETLAFWVQSDASALGPQTSLHDFLANKDSTELFFARRPHGGDTWTPPAPVAITAGPDSNPTTVTLPDGRIMVAWMQHPFPDQHLLAAIWDGQAWSEPTLVVTSSSMDCLSLTLIDGVPAVIWAADTADTAEDAGALPAPRLFMSRWSPGGWLAPERLFAEPTPLRRPATTGWAGLFGGRTFPAPPDECCEECDDWDDNESNVWLPHDPNDIVGPAGYGEAQWMAVGDTFDYMIQFENIPEALAAAQQVRITLPLDAGLDWRTFRLGEFGWDDLVFPVPEDVPILSTRLDLRETRGLFVDVIAGVNMLEREAFWILTSIDPQTGAPPLDPEAGFLPPNRDGLEGQGFVTFRIRPRADSATGAEIAAQATIIFDTEEPIMTPVWSNRLDAAAPVSAMQAEPLGGGRNDLFRLSWSAVDDPGGVGVADYDLYMARGGGAYHPLLTETPATATTFAGADGNAYRFKVVARDRVGNREPLPELPQATILVGEDREPPTAVFVWPADNAPGDHDLEIGSVLANRAPTRLVVHLADVGFGVDHGTVAADAVELHRDGTVLQPGADFAFAYDPGAAEIALTPAAPLADALYEIVFRPRRSAIADLAGNPLATPALSLGLDRAGPTPEILVPAPGVEMADDLGYLDIRWQDIGVAGMEEGDPAAAKVTLGGRAAHRVETIAPDTWRYHYRQADELLDDGPLTIAVAGGAARDRAGNPSPAVAQERTVRLLLELGIDLEPGWNLLAFPVLPEPATWAELLGSLGKHVPAIWTWDGGYARPEQAEADRGYWLLYHPREVPPRRDGGPRLTLRGYRPAVAPAPPGAGWGLLGPRPLLLPGGPAPDTPVFIWDAGRQAYRSVPNSTLPDTAGRWLFGE